MMKAGMVRRSLLIWVLAGVPPLVLPWATPATAAPAAVAQPAGAKVVGPGDTGDAQGEELGQLLFGRLGCHVCHAIVPSGGPSAGPRLFRIYHSTRRLSGGRKVRADDAYLRESILRPTARLTAGYQAVMPAYAGVLDERQVDALILYLKSLR